MPVLTMKTQLTTTFGLNFSNVDAMPAHSNLLFESYILHNMINQMIIPKIGQRSEATYMDIWLLTCIILGKLVNLSYIMLIQLIKVHSNPSTSLVYGNVFAKLFEK